MMGVSLKPITKKRRTPKRKKAHTTTTTTLLTALTTALTSSNTFLTTHDLHLLPSQSLSLHSFLSSAFLSLSKLQSFHSPSPGPGPIQGPILGPIPPSSCWFQGFLISSTTDNDNRWVDFFRMTKPTFYYLLNSSLFKPLLSLLPPSISPDFALASALYKLAHSVSFSFVAKRFGFTSSDACRAFYSVCKVVCHQLGGYLTPFGTDFRWVSSHFDRISLNNCCGVLGVERFPIEGELLGENGFLMVQALVDCDGRFLDVSAGWPSTFDPYSVLRQTRLFLSMEEEVLKSPKAQLFDGNLLDRYVLGDSCYPCLRWLLTPFGETTKGEGLSSVQKDYNEVHRKAMEFARRAFRRVRANWQLLNKRWKEESVEFFPFIITTACVLNNFLMDHGDICCDDELECVRDQDMPSYGGEVDESGARNRDLLALHLSRLLKGQIINLES